MPGGITIIVLKYSDYRYKKNDFVKFKQFELFKCTQSHATNFQIAKNHFNRMY